MFSAGRALILCVLFCLVCAVHAYAQDSARNLEKPLRGKVTENFAPGAVKSTDRKLRGTAVTNDSDFSLSSRKLLTPVQSTQFNSGIDATAQPTFEWPTQPQFPSMDKFFDDGRKLTGDAIKGDPASESSAGTVSNPEDSQPDTSAPQLKTVIVRVTGFNEDTEITPKINLDAFGMANKLLETKKRKCVILLERTSVKLATTGYVDMAVNGNLVDFRKLIKQFMANGGEVVAHKKWCDEFSVQPRDMIGGVRVLPESEVAELILDAEKMVDYATPNYPFNLKFNFGQPNAPSR